MSIRNTYKRNHYIYTQETITPRQKDGGGGKSTMLASGVFFLVREG